MLTCLTKFYSKDCYDANLPKCPLQNYNGIVSTGISDADFIKLCEIIDWKKTLTPVEDKPILNWVCVDVATVTCRKLSNFAKK